MKKKELVAKILPDFFASAKLEDFVGKTGGAFAPSNIALCKYWGKVDEELNIPTANSLSISLGNRGAFTSVTIIQNDLDNNLDNNLDDDLDDCENKDKFEKEEKNENKDIKNTKKEGKCEEQYEDKQKKDRGTKNIDIVELNNKEISRNNPFYIRLVNFLDLFRIDNNCKFIVKTNVNIPIAAGVASSACGFAALILALNKLFNWSLSEEKLSILARLGSGSASRSIWHGFVEWHKCIKYSVKKSCCKKTLEYDNICNKNNLDVDVTCEKNTASISKNCKSLGFNSYAVPLDVKWPDLRVGLLLLDTNIKKVSSKEAMKLSVSTSPFYKLWPKIVLNSIETIKQALSEKDFVKLGKASEENSICMHSIMHTTKPAIVYANSKTIEIMHKIWNLRNDEGLNIFFTQDAGPNLKLLFLKQDVDKVKDNFPDVEVIIPFSDVKV